MELSNEQLQNFNSINQLPYTLVSSSDTPFYTQLAVPQSFGAFQGTDLANFPNDTVQLDVYNDQDFYYETIPAASNYQINGSDIYVDLESELLKAGYDAGDFKVNIRLLRNYLGSASTIKLLVQEISPDRQEIRVIPAKLAGNADSGSQAYANQANAAFSDLFSTNFFAYSKAQVLSGLYVFTDPLTSVEITDYVQDRFTISSLPYSIIFKLNEPLPNTTRVNDTVWISQETNPATTETVYLVPQLKQPKLLRIKGPNFSVVNKKLLGTNTEYKAWDDLLSSNKTETVRALLSESLVEGTPLNVDYTNFENFIKFSSAYERIKNFEYKVKLIENYQSVSSSLAQSTSSGSIYIQTQMSGTLGKIDAVVGAFDGFERYMYFQSSSYVSNSFGEFLDMAWPKSTLTQPYTLYGSSTTRVENWLEGILTSASIYDNSNPYNLQKLVPQHILEQDSDVVESFINMLGHFFDIQYEYISQFTTRYDRQEKLTEGFAKELVYNLAQNLGLDFSNGLNFQDLWSYTLGLDASGSYDNTLKLSGQDRTRELWKRIINNLPYLLKTKGTERGIRALINCFGIPSTILRVKEFSGPEIDFDKTSTFDHDRFYYALNVGRGNTTTQPPHVIVQWSGSDASGTRTTPAGIELRFKAAPFSGSVRRCNLISWYSQSFGSTQTYSNPIAVLDVGRDDGGDFLQFNNVVVSADISQSNPIKLYIPTSSANPALFDGKWVTTYLTYTSANITVGGTPTTSSVTASFGLYAGVRSNYSDTPLIYSASATYSGSNADAQYTPGYANYRTFYWGFTNGNTAQSANQYKTIIIGSSSKAAIYATTASFSGSIQELRYWGTQRHITATGTATYSSSVPLVPQSTSIENSPFYAHVISPTTIVSLNRANSNWTGATSSFDDLVYRQTFGTGNVKTNLYTTTSLSGSQPNQSVSWVRPASFVSFSAVTSSHWTSVVETNYTPWPDLIGNRQTSNKIRIEDTINTSDQLYRNIKTQKSLQDTQPPDSPRLGIYLSPTDQVNEDIAEQFGGISLDDFIGDYSNVYENNYKDLDALKREYAKKSSAKSNPQAYIRLLQHFNGSLFSLIKQMVPYRANLQTGLVIEPHILDRSKVRIVNRPASEDAYYESTVDATLSADLSGDTLDVVGTIDMPQQEIAAESFEQYEGSIDGGTSVTITGKQNEYNRDQVPLQGRRLATLYSTASYDVPIIRRSSLEDTIELNTTSYGRDKNEGSKYRFLTWTTTGSGTYTGFVSNSAGFVLTDSLPKPAWEATGSVILGNRKSQMYLDINGVDVFKGSGSFDNYTTGGTYQFDGVQPDYVRHANAHPVTGSIVKALGLRAYSVVGTTPTTGLWRFDSAKIYVLRVTQIQIATGSTWLSAFPTKNNAIDYSVLSFAYRGTQAGDNATTMSVWLGTSGSQTQPDFTASYNNATSTTFTRTLIGARPNEDLYIEARVSGSGALGGGAAFDNFTSKIYRYAQIQDYHVGPLASIGLRNQKYDGCKLVASDFNEDSPDTIDKGPVITIIEGPAVDLKVNPNTKGTYTFR